MEQLDSTQLMTYCTDISANIRKAFPHLEVHFLVYHQGEKADKIARLLPHLSGHPAFDDAAAILKFRTTGRDSSGFLGIAEGFESSQFGLKKKRRSLAFIALNLSQYSNDDEAMMAAHFLTAHMVETLASLPSNPRPQKGVIMQPKKGHMIACRTNLKADIYSVLQFSRAGIYDAAQRLAHRRCIETLTPQSFLKPEDYPFPLALDVTNYAIENQFASSVLLRGTSQIVSQYQLASQIASCFEAENIQIWTQFAENSQTMAWSGFSASQILGAAVNTSTHPFIKAVGHLLAELTNLSPVDAEHLPNGYNPFLAQEINQIRHDRLVDETFEMILIHTMEAESHLPLVRVANNQNEALLKGRISGWCANALHAAAKAYVGAKERGIPPVQAARLEFQSAKLQSNWKCLMQLGQHVIGLCRKGEAATMPDIIRWCEQTLDAKYILDSLTLTMADPKYAAKLEAATAMPSLGPTTSLAMKVGLPQVKNKSSSPAHALDIPSLSLGSGATLPTLPDNGNMDMMLEDDD